MLVVFGFEESWWDAAECGVAALAVVEDFDEVEECGLGLSACGEGGPVDQLEFEGAPEAFHGGVVVAVAPTTHGGDEAGGLECRPEVACRVLDAPVGVKDHARWRRTMPDGHGQSAKDQAGVDGGAHGPTDKPTAVEVEHAGQVQPAFASLDVGNVPNPDLVGSRGRRRFWQPIGSDGVIVVAVGGPHSILTLLASAEAQPLHQAEDAIAAMSVSQLLAITNNPGRSISLTALCVNPRDLLGQSLILKGSRTGQGPTTVPVVEATGRGNISNG